MDEGRDLITVIEAELELNRHLMRDEKMKPSTFDMYSYSAWAIEQFLFNLYDCSHHMDVSVIRQLIFIHIDQYNKFIDNSTGDPYRYMCAVDAMKQLEIISREFV